MAVVEDVPSSDYGQNENCFRRNGTGSVRVARTGVYASCSLSRISRSKRLTAEEGTMADTKKCAHPACNCTVENGEKYCSTYCRDAKNTVELMCNCQHPGCADEMAHNA